MEKNGHRYRKAESFSQWPENGEMLIKYQEIARTAIKRNQEGDDEFNESVPPSRQLLTVLFVAGEYRRERKRNRFKFVYLGTLFIVFFPSRRTDKAC